MSSTSTAPREHLIEDVIHIITEKQGIPVEVAMTYNTSYNENVYSYVNNINTIEGVRTWRASVVV